MAAQAGLSLTRSKTPKTCFLVTRRSYYKPKVTKNIIKPQHDKTTKWLCAQRRPRSALASAQTVQSLRCALSRTQAFFMRTAKTLIWLIRVFAGRTVTLFVLSCRGSIISLQPLVCSNWASSRDNASSGFWHWSDWVFAGRTLILLVLSCHGSIIMWLFSFLYWRSGD